MREETPESKTTEPTTPAPPKPRYFILEGHGRMSFEARDDAAAIELADALPNAGPRGQDRHVPLWRENGEPVTSEARARGGALPSP